MIAKYAGPSWTNLAVTAQKGATSITLTEPVRSLARVQIILAELIVFCMTGARLESGRLHCHRLDRLRSGPGRGARHHRHQWQPGASIVSSSPTPLTRAGVVLWRADLHASLGNLSRRRGEGRGILITNRLIADLFSPTYR